MNKEFEKMAISGMPVWIFIIPPILLILAPIFDWPYGYYQIVRLVVCLTLGIIAFDEYKCNRKNQASLAGLIVLIFNPFFIIDFDKGVWSVIDFSTAGFWIYYLWTKGLKLDRIIVVFIVPVTIVGIFYIDMSVSVISKAIEDETQRKRTAQIWEERRKAEQMEREEQFRSEEEKRKMEDAEKRALYENAKKIEIVKFSVGAKKTYEPITLSSVVIYLTVKNNNTFPITSMNVSFYFYSKDGNLFSTDRKALSFRYYDALQPGEARTIEPDLFGMLNNDPKGDLSKTKIKITHAYQLEEGERNIRLDDLLEEENATSVSNTRRAQ